MPDATELCALADVKTMLQITGSGEDTLLGLIKNAVEAWAKTYCGRDFLIASYTEYYDGDGGAVLRLDQRPITAISSIYTDPALLFESASLIPASDYVTDPRGRTLGYVELYAYKFLKGRKSVKITYTAGYSTVPYDLSQAIRQIICKQYKVIKKAMFAETSQQVGDMTVTLSPDAWPKDAMEVLRGFRRMAF